MTRQSPQDAIANVERQLDRAVHLLTCMGPGVEECQAVLAEAAECLRAISRESPLDADHLSAFAPQIRRLQQKNVLAQELLNSATSFYCGWLAAGAPASGSYLPAADEARNPGRVLVLEA